MIRFILTLVALTLLYSCQKEKDNSKPVIVVTAPVNYQSINAIDTVPIYATISDNQNIISVTVSVKNANGDLVLNSRSVRPNNSDYVLDMEYFVNDISLPGGQYYFDISADDGENVAHKYVQVMFNAAATTREGVFIVSNNGSTSDIVKLDNAYLASPFASFSGDFLAMEVNSVTQQFFHCASATGDLSILDPLTGNSLWSSSAISSPPAPYFTNLMLHNQEFYVGYYNGNIKRFTASGGANVNANANVGYYVEESAVINNYHVTAQKSIVPGTVNLVLYWENSGAFARQVALNEDVLGIYDYTSTEMVLITNTSAQLGNVVFYYYSTGLIGSPFSVSLAKIESCIEISNGVYLVAEGGNLTIVDVNNFSTLGYLSGVPANLLKYDALSNELFVVNGNQLTVYDYTTKLVVANYAHAAAIDGVAYWYNK